MDRDTPEFDPKHVEQPQEESTTSGFEVDAVSAFNSPEGYDQELDASVYQDDPNFHTLLSHFQKAEWEESLEKISQFLVIHPEDKYLLAFKRDVEARLKQQKTSQQQQVEEKRSQWKRLVLRAFTITAVLIALGLVVLIFNTWAGNVYQANQLAQEATLTAESLAAKYQSAESFMSAGKPEEALSLYTDIQQVDPSYKDIDQKIQFARQSIFVADLYQQGMQALKEGKSNQALEILLKVEELHPKYKDTPQLIQRIQQEQQIAALVKEVQNSFLLGDWPGVIRNYEAIEAIDPFIQLPELKDELFISYRKSILDIVGRSELGLEDIETAEKYYRNALALFPQDKDYVNEREELRKISVELLANKYHLLGISLLESSNYSIAGVKESILILTKAGNLGSDSPAIKTEIEKAQLFLDSYNDFLQRRWDDAIIGFEKLNRRDGNYAGGRVKFFIYEAYTARGDLLSANADFVGAFVDYQEAEKFAWGDGTNFMRVFQIEVRIAAALHKLGRDKESVEFYHYVFERSGYQTRLTNADGQALLDLLVQADLTYKSGDDFAAIRLYEIAMNQKEKLYDQITITVRQGDTLPNIAFENETTIESLSFINRLGESMIIGKDQEFLVPVIPANGQ